MKSLLKKMLYLSWVLVLIMAAGCNESDKEGTKVDEENIRIGEEYSKELASYFPEEEGKVLIYNGFAEYGQTLTLDRIIRNDDKLRLIFKGEIEDVSGGEGPPRHELIFETEYIITKDSVKEVQKNEKRRFSQSIIREQTVLKLPIEEGQKWKQVVNIGGTEYEAATEIVEVSKDARDRNLVKTETIIEGMDSYPGNTYREVKVYREGQGLVEFNNIILLGNGEDGREPTSIKFGYRLFEE